MAEGKEATQVDPQDTGTPETPDATQAATGGTPEAQAPEPYEVLNIKGQDIPVESREKGKALMQKGYHYEDGMRDLKERMAAIDDIVEQRVAETFRRTGRPDVPSAPSQNTPPPDTYADDPYMQAITKLQKAVDAGQHQQAEDRRQQEAEQIENLRRTYVSEIGKHDLLKSKVYRDAADSRIGQRIRDGFDKRYSPDQLVKQVVDELQGEIDTVRSEIVQQYVDTKTGKAGQVAATGSGGAPSMTGEADTTQMSDDQADKLFEEQIAAVQEETGE